MKLLNKLMIKAMMKILLLKFLRRDINLTIKLFNLLKLQLLIIKKYYEKKKKY